MARFMVLLWLLLVTAINVSAKGLIGMNWGYRCAQNLRRDIAVRLLKDNDIDKVKLLDADLLTLKAFAGSGIELMVGIPNARLEDLSDSYDKAKDWVKENVTQHVEAGNIIIKFVAVGNEPLSNINNGSYLKTTLPAIKNIQKALDEAGHQQIKATTPLSADVVSDTFSSTMGPSQADFRKDIKDVMVEMVRWFDLNNSPFLINIKPFLSLYQNPELSFEFGFFDGVVNPITDKGNKYDNLFDAKFDALVWSLTKAGFPKVKIVVGEVGWPTDGNKNANATLAKRFYDGFLKKMAREEGTPLQKGPIQVYLSSLLDENMRSIKEGNFERHWGIFSFDGKPKFPVDLTGQGLDNLWPVAAKGVKYMLPMWCVYNVAITPKNTSTPPECLQYACEAADCTALTFGSSCNHLNYNMNLSYAFNMYFQMNGQDGQSCNFNGLGNLVFTDASDATCKFPIQMDNSAATRLVAIPVSTAMTITSVACFLLILLVLF